jgi:branched-chain amino acid transport system permease protein
MSVTPAASTPAASAAAIPAAGIRRRRIGTDGWVAIVLLLGAGIAAPVLNAMEAQFWVDILNRMMILALAATSLNLLIGVGGLISFGHAVFMGIGAYAVGIAAEHGLDNGFAQLAFALAGSAAFAALTGVVALRTRGAHFIMLTMAFGQMVYFVMIGLKQYGGDDGLVINTRSVFPAPFDIENRTTFYYASWVLLLLAVYGLARIKQSRFGLLLAAAKGSERRVATVGFDPLRYWLAAYVIAGMVCGVAGFLHANLTNFVTPEMMSWTRSGELMFMIILGGVGTVSGPLIGAAAFLAIEEVLGSWTIYWQFWFGAFLIGIVLYARGGLMTFLTGKSER